MRTEDLVELLAVDVPRVPRGVVGRRVVIGIAAGALFSVAALLLTLGARPDFNRAMHGFSFWMKWAYTGSLAIAAIYATTRLARPGGTAFGPLRLLILPVIALAALALLELVRTPPGQWLAMWLGRSWLVCPWLVLLLSVPIFIGLLWSFRRLAPTRLRAAGAAAGLAAGASAATVYCIHCPEVSALFVLTWYSLGILLAAGIGALLGPRLLRW